MVFKITLLSKQAGRATDLLPGYEFLKHNKYTRDFGNDDNLCRFYAISSRILRD